MCDQTEVSYLPGEVVWVKLSHVWWPASVVDQETLEEDVLQGLKKKPLAVVKFFDEDFYEFVKNLNQIYHYNCLHKNDFIKKGLDLCRSDKSRDVPSSMKKFPDDIVTAEILTKGNPEILKDPIFKPANIASIEVQLGFKKTPKSVKKERIKNEKDLKTPVRIKEEPMDSTCKTKHYQSFIRLQFVPYQFEYIYRCGKCPYSTVNKELLVMHSHVHRAYDESGAPIKHKNRGISTPRGKMNKIFKRKNDTAGTSSAKRKNKDVAVVRKRKKKNLEEDEKQNNEAIRENILKDWDESENSDADDTLNDSEILGTTMHAETDSEYDSPKKDTESQKDKSCFDFEDEEETINLDSPMKFGQKLPRVISPEKPKKQDLVTDDITEDSNSHDMSKEVSDLLNDTKVPEAPQLPEVSKLPIDEKSSPVEKPQEEINENNVKSPAKEPDVIPPIPEKEEIPKSPSYENSPLKKRKQNFIEPEKDIEEKITPPLKKRKPLKDEIEPIEETKDKNALEEDAKIQAEINAFLGTISDKPNSKDIQAKKTEEAQIEDNLIEESTKSKEIIDIPTSPSKNNIQEESEFFLDKAKTQTEPPGEEETNFIDSEMILEENIVIDNTEIFEKDETVEKKVENNSPEKKEPEKSVAIDPSEMELDINSMPIVMDDELIPDLKQPTFLEPPSVSAPQSNLKQVKITLKKPTESKTDFINGKQIITIPGKKPVKELKSNLVESIISNAQVRTTPTISPSTILIKTPKNQEQQKYLILPSDSSNGQTLVLSDGEKLIKTSQVGTRIITTKGLITQSAGTPITLAGGKKGFYVKKTNILSSNKPPLSKTNILAASTSKAPLKNIVMGSSTSGVKIIGQPKLLQIQRPGLKPTSKPPIMYVQSTHKTVGLQRPPTPTPSPVKKTAFFKTRQASPNILQKAQRKPAPRLAQKVVRPPAQEEMISIPVMQNIQPESEQIKMVYLAVDGSCHPINNPPIKTSSNNIFLDNTGEMDKFFLSIDDNGQLTNINPTPTTKAPAQDILAKALANTQLLQNDTSDSLDTPVIYNQPYTGQHLSLSQNMLETSFTINQPIMTPQEVPSSIAPMSTSIIDDKKDLQPSMPLLSDDLEGRAVYITNDPSTSSQQFTIQVLNDNLVDSTSTSGQLSHVIYTSEPLPIETLQKKTEIFDETFETASKSEYTVIDSSEVESKMEENLPNVDQDDLVVEQVDSLNEPFMAADV